MGASCYSNRTSLTSNSFSERMKRKKSHDAPSSSTGNKHPAPCSVASSSPISSATLRFARKNQISCLNTLEFLSKKHICAIGIILTSLLSFCRRISNTGTNVSIAVRALDYICLPNETPIGSATSQKLILPHFSPLYNTIRATPYPLVLALRYRCRPLCTSST